MLCLNFKTNVKPLFQWVLLSFKFNITKIETQLIEIFFILPVFCIVKNKQTKNQINNCITRNWKYFSRGQKVIFVMANLQQITLPQSYHRFLKKNFLASTASMVTSGFQVFSVKASKSFQLKHCDKISKTTAILIMCLPWTTSVSFILREDFHPT